MKHLLLMIVSRVQSSEYIYTALIGLYLNNSGQLNLFCSFFDSMCDVTFNWYSQLQTSGYKDPCRRIARLLRSPATQNEKIASNNHKLHGISLFGTGHSKNPMYERKRVSDPDIIALHWFALTSGIRDHIGFSERERATVTMTVQPTVMIIRVRTYATCIYELPYCLIWSSIYTPAKLLILGSARTWLGFGSIPKSDRT